MFQNVTFTGIFIVMRLLCCTAMPTNNYIRNSYSTLSLIIMMDQCEETRNVSSNLAANEIR